MMHLHLGFVSTCFELFVPLCKIAQVDCINKKKKLIGEPQFDFLLDSYLAFDWAILTHKCAWI